MDEYSKTTSGTYSFWSDAYRYCIAKIDETLLFSKLWRYAKSSWIPNCLEIVSFLNHHWNTCYPPLVTWSLILNNPKSRSRYPVLFWILDSIFWLLTSRYLLISQQFSLQLYRPKMEEHLRYGPRKNSSIEYEPHWWEFFPRPQGASPALQNTSYAISLRPFPPSHQVWFAFFNRFGIMYSK